MPLALKQERLDLTATKVVKNKDYLNISIAKIMEMMDREKFDKIMDKVKPNLALKGTAYGGRFELVFEIRKDGKGHLLGIEISKQELDPQTGEVLLPIPHQFVQHPDYWVKFQILEEPLKSELVEELNRRMQFRRLDLELEKD